MRDTFIRTLFTIAQQDPRVVLLTGDLGFGVLTKYAAELPNQYINVGVAEQNLTGLATGLALSGHVVFTYSIGNFPTLRCLEQIRNDACYHQASVKIVAVGGGFSYGPLGMSHHATEDLAILRALPDMTVLCPGDLAEAEAATYGVYRTPGTCYLRLDKSHAPHTEKADPPLVPGKIRQLREGTDVVIFSAGGITAEAIYAADLLRESGMDCGVYSVHTIHPLDVQGILAASNKASFVATMEEHTLSGGLGSAVAETFADHGFRVNGFRRFGVQVGSLSIVGSQTYLRERHGLDGKTVSRVIERSLRARV